MEGLWLLKSVELKYWRNKMDWFKKHSDAVAVIAVIIGAMVWMNGRLNEIEKDISTIKTVLIMKNIMPKELAAKED